MGEVELAALLCAFLSGSQPEARRYFDANGLSRYIRVDCETDTHVIEIGLDGTSSARDSIHQAVFAATLTGKTPLVVMIDQDGYEGRFEFEIRQVAHRLGVAHGVCDKAFILRWAATAPLRAAGLDKDVSDLPRQTAAQTHCDLSRALGEPGEG